MGLPETLPSTAGHFTLELTGIHVLHPVRALGLEVGAMSGDGLSFGAATEGYEEEPQDSRSWRRSQIMGVPPVIKRYYLVYMCIFLRGLPSGECSVQDKHLGVRKYIRDMSMEIGLPGLPLFTVSA